MTDAPFHVAVAVALLRESLRAVAAREWFEQVVRAHVVLHIRHLPESFQANFALSSLVQTTGLLVENLRSAPQLLLADYLRVGQGQRRGRFRLLVREELIGRYDRAVIFVFSSRNL